MVDSSYTAHPITRPEVLIDRQLAILHAELEGNRRNLTRLTDSAHYAIRDRRSGSGRRAYWLLSDLDAWEQVRVISFSLHSGARGAQDLLLAQREVEAHIDALLQAIDTLNIQFVEAGGWSRFYLVPGGHIHSSTACHTLKITTQIGWLPELSGLDERSAVEAHGAILCTVCFPSAPVEWTNGLDKQEDPERCPGSLTGNYDRATARVGFYSGNAGTCNECGQRVTLTRSYSLRTHKRG